MTTLEHLSPRVLRDLAAAIEGRSSEMRARAQLTAEGVEKLADILLAGGQPTIGFWKRYRRADEVPS